MKPIRFFQALLFVSIPFVTNAQEFVYDGLFYEVLDPEAKTCTTRAGSVFNVGNIVEGDLVIPEHAIYDGNTYTVTEIGDFGFYHNQDKNPFTTSVKFPNTLTRIGKYAFSMQDLKEIEIPASVERIEEQAFSHNKKLHYVHFNEGLKFTDLRIFAYCPNLKELTLPATLETIGGHMLGEAAELNGCSLNNLICNSFTPPTLLDPDNWEKINALPFVNTTLYVPNGAKENYLKAPGWSSFGNDNTKEIDRLMVFFDQKTCEMTLGATTTLHIIYSYDTTNSATIPINLEFTSSDESVATVTEGRDQNGQLIGVVKTLGVGTARITLTAYPMGASQEPCSTYCDIIVKPGCASISLDEDFMEIGINETKTLSLDITGIEPGQATVTVIISYDNGEEITHKCEVVVVDRSLSELDNVFDIEEGLIDVYTLGGVCVLRQVQPQAVRTLSPGLYVAGNKTLLVK